MAVSGRRRFDDDKVVKYETAEKDFEVEVRATSRNGASPYISCLIARSWSRTFSRSVGRPSRGRRTSIRLLTSARRRKRKAWRASRLTTTTTSHLPTLGTILALVNWSVLRKEWGAVTLC